MTAYSAAGRVNPKAPRAIVAVNYETRTPNTLADEDDLLGYVSSAVGGSAHDLRPPFSFLLYDQRETWGGAGTVVDPMRLQEAVEAIHSSRLFVDAGKQIVNRIVEEFPRSERRVLLQRDQLVGLAAQVARAYFLHLVETDLWQTMKRLPEKLKDYARADAWRSAPSEQDLKRKGWQHKQWRAAIRNRPRSMKGTWHRLRKEVEALSRALPEMTDDIGAYRHNVRAMDPIGFTGKNKIVFAAVIDDKGSWQNPTEITVHYNRSPQALDLFVNNFRDRIGKNFYVVDKHGNVLLDEREEQQVAASKVASRYRNARHMRRLYHGTSSENLDAIKRGGLRGDPARRLFEDDVDRPMPGHIYLTPDPGVATSYAGRASRQFGGERLVLVFHMRPNDPRFVADEDWLASVRGFIIDSGAAWYKGNLSQDLGALWALAKGETDQYPLFLNVPYGSREHVKILIDTEMALRFGKTLDRTLNTFHDTIADGKPSTFAEMVDDMDEAEVRRHADRLTRVVRKAMEKMLHQYAPHPWVPAERILQFLLDPFLHDLANLKGISGHKRDVWPALQERLVKEWPEWFGPEAAIISQRPGGGHSATVALKAPNLKPDEGWIIDRSGKVLNYADLGRKGKQVF